MHGHFGRKENHLPVSERFCAIGFRCLLFDVPDHGEHPSPTTTFALNEAMLPRAVLESAAQRFGFDPRPAGLFVALSLGGAIALIAAVQERDADIHSVVTECSYPTQNKSKNKLKKGQQNETPHNCINNNGPYKTFYMWLHSFSIILKNLVNATPP